MLNYPYILLNIQLLFVIKIYNNSNDYYYCTIVPLVLRNSFTSPKIRSISVCDFVKAAFKSSRVEDTASTLESSLQVMVVVVVIIPSRCNASIIFKCRSRRARSASICFSLSPSTKSFCLLRSVESDVVSTKKCSLICWSCSLAAAASSRCTRACSCANSWARSDCTKRSASSCMSRLARERASSFSWYSSCAAWKRPCSAVSSHSSRCLLSRMACTSRLACSRNSTSCKSRSALTLASSARSRATECDGVVVVKMADELVEDISAVVVIVGECGCFCCE
mmetsp:Transcript_10219/g.15656  ORF Transcript_10219/g.15656 Transcript_10219/m.15656 type:complete len:280 (+) Transcript_10219:48-887(+)